MFGKKIRNTCKVRLISCFEGSKDITSSLLCKTKCTLYVIKKEKVVDVNHMKLSSV